MDGRAVRCSAPLGLGSQIYSSLKILVRIPFFFLARWMEVIKRATSSPARSSLLLPQDKKDSNSD